MDIKKTEESLKKAVIHYNYLLDEIIKEAEGSDLLKLFVWAAQRHLKQKGYVPYHWIEYLQSELGGNDESTSN